MNQADLLPENKARVAKLMARAIATLGLDLSGLTVLTEVGTKAFMTTPMIAASRAWAQELGCADAFAPTARRPIEVAGAVDIVTNLRFVRPIDAHLIAALKPTAAISLMWEPWEFREEDLDLPACRARGVAIAGTPETHEDLQIFHYLGATAVKLLLEAEIEVVRSVVGVIGSPPFLAPVQDAVAAMGATVRIVDPFDRTASWDDLDAVVVAEHTDRRMLIGEGGLDPARVSHAVIVHICGAIDADKLAACGVRVHPPTPASVGYMTVTTGHAGPRAVVDLHAAGLKVGATVARARLAGLDVEAAVCAAVESGYGLPLP